MRSRTTQILRAAFSTAILTACRDKSETPPPVPTPTTTTAATPPPITSTTRLPTMTRPGQRCAGSTVIAAKPATPVDYLELRLDSYAMYTDAREIVNAGSVGTACATAKDKAKCTSDVGVIKAKSPGEYLVYTRGDEVATVQGEQVAAFLGSIDNAEEAALALVNSLARTGTSTAAILPECDPKKFTKTSAGWEATYVVTGMCIERHDTTYLVAPDGSVKVTKQVDVPEKADCPRPFLGRRPDGMVASFDGREVAFAGCAQFFAECTEMEAASVAAFGRLESELARLGAPTSLRRRARRSASDERRHARTMGRFARRFAGAPRKPMIARFTERPAVAMAIENATSGCVFETWAALVGEWQARHATDPEIREAMRTIARDETRHAALAHDVAAWLEPRLTDAERARVAAAREAAIEKLRRDVATPVSIELQALCGLPGSADAAVLLEAFLTLDLSPPSE
ncbi:hypothetical protein BH09MYX1_BH09MYX1_44120 [soil metagenome]